MGLQVLGGRGTAPEALVVVLGEPFLAWPWRGPALRSGWRRPRPQPRRPAGQRPRAREGASPGREPGERVALSVPGSSWAVHVAPAAAVSAAQLEVGARPSRARVGGRSEVEGVFGEG